MRKDGIQLEELLEFETVLVRSGTVSRQKALLEKA
jgi:hypothetical protein